jgi:hypothetical protein
MPLIRLLTLADVAPAPPTVELGVPEVEGGLAVEQ